MMKGKKEVPITELANVLSKNIDKASSKEIVHVLRECDKEIFHGWKGYQCVQDKEFINKIEQVACQAAEFVSAQGSENSSVILSGCGTSGRIAFLISRAFNELATEQQLQPCYRYICSGGDHGLMKSIESCEDEWNVGKTTLEEEAKGLQRVLFIGITCGLSAPFVGGQVEYCLQHPERFTPYLLGFNPATQARTAPIKGTSKVLLDISREMNEKGYLLNPVVGPEAITGSSRMKGGTTTKMILECIFTKAHQLALGNLYPTFCEQAITAYQKTMDLTYSNSKDIACVIDLAGHTLGSGHHVIYLGWGTLGIMGMIDAAECVPTFGASYHDVRSFIKGGYGLLRNKFGDLSDVGDSSEISFNYFIEKKCHSLSEDDLVVFLFRSLSSEDKALLREMSGLVKARGCKVVVIGITASEEEHKSFDEALNLVENPTFAHVCLPSTKLKEFWPDLNDTKQEEFLVQCLTEISLKWVVNAVTTGGHILKGKVMKNYMIDLKLSNRKLFERAVSIVALLGGISCRKAKDCLLKSIYRTDKLPESVVEADISDHISIASLVSGVVPIALLLSKHTFTLDSALKALEVYPIVRHCIEKFQ